MLKQRVLTALVLLCLILPVLSYSDPAPFRILTGLFLAAGAWEWARLNGLDGPAALALGAVCLAGCFGFWWLGWAQQRAAGLWLAGGLAWVLGGAWILFAGVGAWTRLPRPLRVALGLFALALTWLALAQAKDRGVNFLLSVLALVWVADIGAYFAGRALGGRFFARKLAPSVSPGKSWEGVLGGMLGVLLCAALWRTFDARSGTDAPSFYSAVAGQDMLFGLLAVLLMTAMSVVGDLVESLVKRSAGVKDSSALLPGHGGVLDRVDALLPTLPLAMMLTTM